MYENPEQPPPFTPTRRRVDSSGRPWSLMTGAFVEEALARVGVRHADVLQKSDQFELQRLYRALGTGDAGELQIIGGILQMFKATAIRFRGVGSTFHDRD